ncbi:MAG TPA: M20 family metallopeptidase [Actinomycetota bacterium]|nr:M20 family metallopeptidase [Actinomycetota bacterium]
METVAMVEALRRLVEAESFSSDPQGVARCAGVIDDLCAEVLGSPAQPRGPHRVWRREGGRPVLLLCHFDTVWPPGTLGEFPFTVDDGVARGPGAFDMKAGIVQALAAVRDTDGPLTILFNGDEEIGSPTSRALIEEEARAARAVLVMEPAAGPAVKVARKGVGQWTIDVEGRAAHPGLAPERGINAAVELAHQVLAIQDLARPQEGTTVTVTTLDAGTAGNVIPPAARCTVDVRMWTLEEAARAERGLASLRPVLAGARLRVDGGLNRGPMERRAAEPLYERLRGLGYDVPAAEVGGASDGNFTAALGIPTLDGLGPVGGGAHAREEHVLVDEMPARARMVARLIADLLSEP